MYNHIAFMNMNRILTSVLALFVGGVFCLQPVSAQSDEQVKVQKEVIRNRKAMSKLTRKQVSDNVWKQSKKQAKAWKKEGWKSCPGAPSLDQQMNDALMYQYEMDGEFPRYIVGRSSAKAGTYALAHKQAIARARLDIASSIQVEVAELVENTELNTEMSLEEVETVGKIMATGQQLVQQTLGRTNVVFEAYREVNGKTEVMVTVGYDGRAAKSTVMKMFEKEGDALRQKMENLLESKENK